MNTKTNAAPARPPATLETLPSPFIPAWLDDACLTPAQFRVLCRVARRGACWEGLKSIAAGCRMRRETAQAAIKQLLSMGLMSKVSRKGATSVLSVTPSGKEGLGTQRQRGANHLAGKRGYEGIPHEGSPEEGKKIDTLARVVGFSPPTEDEVLDYAWERGWSIEAAPEFMRLNTRNGWRVRGQPMRDWRAAFDGFAESFPRAQVNRVSTDGKIVT